MFDTRIIRRLAYDGNYQRAIELIVDIIDGKKNYFEVKEDIESHIKAKTQQTLDQIAEKNKHIKRNYDDTIEIEEDYLRELLETINNLCEANKILQDQFELSQKLVSVLQDKLRRY